MAVARHVKVVMGAMEFGRPQRESADAAVVSCGRPRLVAAVLLPLGYWLSLPPQCRAMLRACTEAGVRELDTARM